MEYLWKFSLMSLSTVAWESCYPMRVPYALIKSSVNGCWTKALLTFTGYRPVLTRLLVLPFEGTLLRHRICVVMSNTTFPTLTIVRGVSVKTMWISVVPILLFVLCLAQLHTNTHEESLPLCHDIVNYEEAHPPFAHRYPRLGLKKEVQSFPKAWRLAQQTLGPVTYGGLLVLSAMAYSPFNWNWLFHWYQCGSSVCPCFFCY